MNKKQELERLVRGIPDTYKDFIRGTMQDAEDYNAYDKLINFIKNTPNVTSSDVVKFITENLYGIRPFTDEEKQAYLDSLKKSE